jgi:dTDP-4-amino-4,6-dideoxygalactose transaminase
MVAFNDLRAYYRRDQDRIDQAVARVLARSWFILGPELEGFEHEFAAYHGGGHAVGVANGTDAIEIALRAAGIEPGDEVITVSHTAVPTVCGIERSGAVPVLVEIDPRTYTIDPEAAAAAVTARTRAIVAVHLYGHPADLSGLRRVAERHGLLLIEDCAQAHGARYEGRPVGTFGELAAFSFYPTKNVGAFGDAGAVMTRDPALAGRARRLRNYGQQARHHHIERGLNSRLDEIQAAILRVRLSRLDEDNQERRRLAALYCDRIPAGLVPARDPHHARIEHVYHLFVIRHPGRDRLRGALAARGIETAIHYPVPVHLQPAYAGLGYPRGSLPRTERAALEVLSLPLFVGLEDRQVELVTEAIHHTRRDAA